MKPILLDLPHEILTPRLRLRGPQAGDGPALNEAVRESWENLAPWMPWARGEFPSVEDSEIRVRQGAARWILREDLWVMIFDRVTNKYIGGTGLHQLKWDLPSAEIGYWVRSSCQGQGYISESTNALTRFAFDYLKCKRLEIRCNSRNIRSKKVMESLGFTPEGCLHGSDTHAIGGGDTLIYARFDKSGLPQMQVSWE